MKIHMKMNMKQNSVLCVVYTKISHKEHLHGLEGVQYEYDFKFSGVRSGILGEVIVSNPDNYPQTIYLNLEDAKTVENIALVTEPLKPKDDKTYAQLALYQRREQLYNFNVKTEDKNLLVKLHKTNNLFTVNYGDKNINYHDYSFAMQLQIDLEAMKGYFPNDSWLVYKVLAQDCEFAPNEPVNHEIWITSKIQEPPVRKPYQGWNEWFDELQNDIVQDETQSMLLE